MDSERAEKLQQLEKILQSQALQSSETLKAFFKFVVLKTIENQDSNLKEYVIATEVFGRNSNYDPRVDSVVRVQALRLRSKLQEYYATEGKHDDWLIDLPKGQYSVVFSRIDNSNGSGSKNDQLVELDSEISSSKEDLFVQETNKSFSKGPWVNKWLIVACLGLTVLSLVLGIMAFKNRNKDHSRGVSVEASRTIDSEEMRAIKLLWGGILSSPEPVLVTYSNAVFTGIAETGMKLVEPLDSPKRWPKSTANESQSLTTTSTSNQPITSHYTGIGEVMGVHFLGNLFWKADHPFRIKRSLMLNWDDMKVENIVVLGSSAENYLTRDLPQEQNFVFRVLKNDKGEEKYGILNLNPQQNEQQMYFATEEGPSTTQVTEDYAVISLLKGLDTKRKLLILGGIKTFGTQAAAEYMTRPEYMKALMQKLNTSSDSQAPSLPPYYQVLIKVKVNGGVPVHISYVTHRVLN
jgi:hypothetical protein